ncbi:MAG TPA: cell division protein ZapE [Woeseiaceae bacterium]|nr:cell division protein ZapE [Woeseiaceae bacterium]
MRIREAWEQSLKREGHVRDAAQAAMVDRLAALAETLEAREAGRRGWLARWIGRPPPPVRGLYLWGGVGRGKTFLMDLFFETLAVGAKRRVHFHRMLADVHARLRALDDVSDPLDQVAADVAGESRVLCFDEFFVSDIGDAMILARFLEGLFARNVTLVTTSNAHPDDLYRDGLQRSRFLPAIELLKKHTQVVHMDGGTDYRLRLLEHAGTYLAPHDAAADARLERLFEDAASSAMRRGEDLEINGRPIRTRRFAKGIAWFDFEAVCDGPRSQADYIELARWYPTVIVSGVPRFDVTREDQARRFIALVDEFYDRGVKLILSAAVPIAELYAGERLGFEFERTVSRLTEMQSGEYLARPHLS